MYKYGISSQQALDTLSQLKIDPLSDQVEPSFGLGDEHNGPITLGEWADQRGLVLSASNA